MNQFSGPKSCTAGEALARGTRVKIDTANSTSFKLVVVAAGKDDPFMGWVEEDTDAGSPVAITYRGTGGEMTLANSSVMAIGDQVYTSADGKHSTTNTGQLVGMAVSACGADAGVKTVLY